MGDATTMPEVTCSACNEKQPEKQTHLGFWHWKRERMSHIRPVNSQCLYAGRREGRWSPTEGAETPLSSTGAAKQIL